MTVTNIASFFRRLLRRASAKQEIDEELRFHIDRETEALVASGLSESEARRRARAIFGGLDAIREECREARRAHILDATFQDVRYGFRVMVGSPGFTATAVLILASSIGAACTVLTIAYAFFARTLPVPDPEEIVEVRVTRNSGSDTGFASYSDYAHFREGVTTLRDYAAFYPTAPLFVTDRDRARQVNGAAVSASFFDMLDIEPAHGRFFRADEDVVPDRDRTVVLSRDFWSTWFGGSADALGASVVANGVSFRIVGVLPPSFRGIGTAPADIYMPTMMLGVAYRWCSVIDEPDCTILRMAGRLAPGVSLDRARAEVATLIPPRWRDAAPGDNSGVVADRLRGSEIGATDVRFLVLLSLVAGVLVLVCAANLAGLLIARGTARRHELAIRASIGAARGRLVRQLLTESLLLSLVGGVLGVWVSVALTAALNSMFFSSDGAGRPVHVDLGLEPGVVGIIVALAVALGLIFGVIPALISSRAGTEGGLRASTARNPGRSGTGRWLLGGQAASAVALVIVAGLLTASARHLVGGANFEPSGVALLRLRPRLVEYPPARAQQFLRAVIDRLEAHPEVESMSMVATGGALGGWSATVADPEDYADTLEVGYIEIGPRYFETLRTPLLLGREFSDNDNAAAPPVAVVSASLAARLWPDRNAVGATVRIEGTVRTVVGVVADVPLQTRAEPTRPYAFVPYWQNPEPVATRLQVRVAGDPASKLPSLAREIHAVDPEVPVTEMVTLADRLAGNFRAVRMSATAAAYAGALATVLSAVGLYASLAAAVSRRRREIGIRQAIGASSPGILAMITREGMSVVLPGIAVGFGLAFAAMRFLRHLLYGSAAADPVAYGLAGALIALVGLVACWIPARRAARITPMEALRLD